MKLRSVSVALVGLLLALIGVSAFVVGMGVVVRPEIIMAPPVYEAEEVQAVEEARSIHIDPDKPCLLYTSPSPRD